MTVSTKTTVTTPETNHLFLVGITGTMGCGKSTVTELFAQRGARVLDADKMARTAVEPGSAGWREVVAAFGQDMLLAGIDKGGFPALDRKKLAATIFSDPAKRKLLEGIIHPKIAAARVEILQEWQRELATGGQRIVVMEIPLLFETGAEDYCDLTLAVTCGKQQWQRLGGRQSMSDTTKAAAIAQQLPEVEKKHRADRTIDNSGSLAATVSQVEQLWQELIVVE
jgi:dephospho-CoA kinase